MAEDQDILDVIEARRKRRAEAEALESPGNPFGDILLGGVGAIASAMSNDNADYYGKGLAARDAKQKSTNEKRLKAIEDDDTDLKSLMDLSRARRSEESQQRQFAQQEKMLNMRSQQRDPVAAELAAGRLADQQLKRDELAYKKTPKGRLEGSPTETKSKIGLLVGALNASTDYESAMGTGAAPEYVDANTPVIGRAMSDTEISRTARQMTEAIGRLNSGGAIGAGEETRFLAMIPRPGDSKEMRAKKVQTFRQEMETRLTGFGFQPQELAEAGFDSGRMGYDEDSIANRSKLMSAQAIQEQAAALIPNANADDSAPTAHDLAAKQWLDANPGHPYAPNVVAKLRARGIQ